MTIRAIANGFITTVNGVEEYQADNTAVKAKIDAIYQPATQ